MTGATGFVGKVLIQQLRDAGVEARPLTRAEGFDLEREDAPWVQGLRGARSLVHLAGLAHVTQGRGEAEMARYLSINTEGSRRLFEAAQEAGLARVVLVSSVNASGVVATEPGAPLRDGGEELFPKDPYGRSKRAAEDLLLAAASLNPVVLRPPLVVGRGAKANLKLLIQAVEWGIPLPLGAVQNRRSLIGVEALAQAILLALAGKATGRFYVADPSALSIGEMIRAIADGMERKPRLLGVPERALTLALQGVGLRGMAHKLCGSLEVDASRFIETFGKPSGPSAQQALAAAGAEAAGR